MAAVLARLLGLDLLTGVLVDRHFRCVPKLTALVSFWGCLIMAVVSFRVKNTHKKKPAFFCFKFLNVVYFLLHWVFVTVCRVSLIVASEGSSAVRRLLIAVASLVWSTGSRRTGSVVVAHRLSRPMACGIFPDQGSNPCPLHWQADALSPDHQGSPEKPVFCNLVSDMAGQHFCVLFLRGRSASPAHT